MSKKFLLDANRSEIDQYFEDQAAFLLQKQKLERIDNFNGYFDFLNNEYPCQVYFDGLLFKSVAYAYQAARSVQRHIREKIALADNTNELYEIASKIDDPENWTSLRLKYMESLIRDKFRRNRDLRERLMATGTRELINTYSDPTISNIFWGVVENKGQNQLGRLLQQVRNDCSQSLELEKWLYMVFELEDNKAFIPKISLKVLKGGEQIESIELKEKSIYFFGTLKTNDVIMAHQSISRNHAVIIIDQKLGPCLIDLHSKSFTYIDGKRMEAHLPYKLKNNFKIHFAVSSRIYLIDIDYSSVEANFEIKKKTLEKEKIIYEKLQDVNVSKEVLMASLGLVAEDTIFISNLPDSISTQDINEFFKEFGKIKETKLPFDKKTGRLKRICFLTFETEKEAKNGLKADGRTLKSKKIRVSLAEKKSSDQLLIDKLEGKSKEEVMKNVEKYEKMIKEEFEARFGGGKNEKEKKEQKEKEKEQEQEKTEKQQKNDKTEKHVRIDKRGKHDKHAKKDGEKDKEEKKEKPEKKDSEKIEEKEKEVKEKKEHKKKKHNKKSSERRSRSRSRSGSKKKKNNSK